MLEIDLGIDENHRVGWPLEILHGRSINRLVFLLEFKCRFTEWNCVPDMGKDTFPCSPWYWPSKFSLRIYHSFSKPFLTFPMNRSGGFGVPSFVLRVSLPRLLQWCISLSWWCDWARSHCPTHLAWSYCSASVWWGKFYFCKSQWFSF